jgi:hypothetical protein
MGNGTDGTGGPKMILKDDDILQKGDIIYWNNDKTSSVEVTYPTMLGVNASELLGDYGVAYIERPFLPCSSIEHEWGDAELPVKQKVWPCIGERIQGRHTLESDCFVECQVCKPCHEGDKCRWKNVVRVRGNHDTRR